MRIMSSFQARLTLRCNAWPRQAGREPCASRSLQGTPCLALLVCCCAGLIVSVPALAQDAGSQLRRYQDETQRRMQAAPSNAIPAGDTSTRAPNAATAASKAQVFVTGYEVHGVTLFPAHEIKAVLEPFTAKVLSTAEIHAAADALMRHYRSAGYMLAKVFVPPQRFTAVVRLDVEEGHLEHGGVELDVKGHRVRPEVVQAFLEHHLQSDVPLKRRELERALLLADDLPGTRIGSIIYPGKEVGAARLRAVMSDEPLVAGNVDFDNFNNRAMGQERLGTTLYLNSPGGAGDQFVTRLVTSGGRSQFAYVTYLRPLGGSGLRIGASLDHFSYNADVAALPGNISGRASDARVYLTYPLIRSRHTNLNVRADLAQSRLLDRSLNTLAASVPGVDPSTASERRVNLLQVTLSGDETHDFLPNGTTLFEATAAAGTLDVTGNAAYRAYDAAGPKTEGRFARLSYSVKRLQHLTGPWSLYGSLDGQLASRNLDASQRYYLGGAISQAGYPVGEASGDQGTEIHLELRRDFVPTWGGNLQVGLFYTQGWVQRSRSPWQNTDNRESLKSAGIQVTQTIDRQWVLRGLVGGQLGSPSAFAQQNGRNSDDRSSRYRLWVQAVRYFESGAKP